MSLASLGGGPLRGEEVRVDPHVDHVVGVGVHDPAEVVLAALDRLEVVDPVAGLVENGVDPLVGVLASLVGHLDERLASDVVLVLERSALLTQ